jgi:hypothetical protein
LKIKQAPKESGKCRERNEEQKLGGNEFRQ